MAPNPMQSIVRFLVAGMLVTIATSGEAALVAYYPLDGNADAVVGPNGAINGNPTPTVGAVDTALDFDGSDDFVDVGAGAMSGGSYSMSAWAKADALSGIAYIAGVQYSNKDGGRLFRLNEDTPEIQHIAGDANILGKNGAAVTTGDFVHVVATFNDVTNELRWYQNGSEVTPAVSVANNSNYVRKNFKIGRRPDGGGTNFFNGVIDDVAIYNHALTPTEVDTVYSSGVLALESQRSDTGTLGRQPYETDAHTLHLYHLDETTGSYIDTAGGIQKDLDQIGGTRETFAADGMGSAFTVTSSNLGNNALVKGVSTATSDTQSIYQGTDGAFTYEALVSVNTIDPSASEQIQIISREGDGSLANRSFQFRIDQGSLEFIGLNSSGAQNLLATIPTSGDHAFVPNDWFHVAVTYDGDPTNSENLKFYWTALDSSATEAFMIDTGQLTADLTPTETGIFSIGSMRRGGYRTPLLGSMDEVRISDIARAPGEFLFAAPVPEPNSLVLVVLGVCGAGIIVIRRRKDACRTP